MTLRIIFAFLLSALTVQAGPIVGRSTTVQLQPSPSRTESIVPTLGVDKHVRQDGTDPSPSNAFSLPPGGITLTVIQAPTPAMTTIFLTIADTPTAVPVPIESDADIGAEATETVEPESALTSTALPPVSTKSATNPNSSGGKKATSSGNIGANDTSAAQTQRVSSSLIAVIAVLSILAVLSFLVGLFIFLRSRKRRQSLLHLPDPEQDPKINSRTPLRAPEFSTNDPPNLSMRQANVNPAPQRPRNPFEDVSPPNVPLDVEFNLEEPRDSTLVKKRMGPGSNGPAPWVSRSISRPSS